MGGLGPIRGRSTTRHPWPPTSFRREWQNETPMTDIAACVMRGYAPGRAWSKRPTPGPGIGSSAPSTCPPECSIHQCHPRLRNSRRYTSATSVSNGEPGSLHAGRVSAPGGASRSDGGAIPRRSRRDRLFVVSGHEHRLRAGGGLAGCFCRQTRRRAAWCACADAASPLRAWARGGRIEHFDIALDGEDIPRELINLGVQSASDRWLAWIVIEIQRSLVRHL
jgi:hypothetical protein